MFEMAEPPIESWSDAALAEELVTLCREADRLQARIAALVRLFDSRRAFAAEGSLSTVAWLRRNCRLSGWAASELVQVARELGELPLAETAFASGDLSYENVRLMARTSAAVGAETYRSGEAQMVEFGSRLAPHQFRILNDRVRHLLDPDGALADAQDSYERRWVRLSPLLDGMFALDGLLDAEGGACLQAALDALMGPASREDRRTTGQRRADALVELSRQQLDGGALPRRGGVKPHLSLVARAGQAGELEWAGLVPVATVRRLACDCDLTPIKVDSAGQVLDVGRARRTISSALRRALVARDRGCRWPGCGRPPGWTDGHHLRHWQDGGPTSLANTVLLCRRHHRRCHEEGWRLQFSPGGELVALPP